jgi:hypothetical protein
MKLAIVLYSYAGRIAKQQQLAGWCYDAISRIKGVSLFVTSRAGQPALEPPCFERIPLATEDAYELLPDKTMEMLQWLQRRSDWDIVIKCDDDVILDPAAIRGLVQISRFPSYAGTTLLRPPPDRAPSRCHMGRCRSEHLNRSAVSLSWASDDFVFAAGSCFAMDRQAVETALDELAAWELTIEQARDRLDMRGVAEDVLVGYLLSRRNIRPADSICLLTPRCGSDWLRFGRDQAWSRLVGRRQDVAWLGLLTPNRPLRRYERLLLSGWLPISGALPTSRYEFAQPFMHSVSGSL